MINDFPQMRSVVYFAEVGERGPIKIGVSATSLRNRIWALQQSSPWRVRLLAIVDGSRGLEIELHKKFSSHRMIGEFYQRCEEILKYISDNCVAVENGYYDHRRWSKAQLLDLATEEDLRHGAVRIWRYTNGMSQSFLASQIGSSIIDVIDVERGAGKIEVVRAISAYTGIPVLDIISPSPSLNPPSPDGDH